MDTISAKPCNMEVLLLIAIPLPKALPPIVNEATIPVTIKVT